MDLREFLRALVIFPLQQKNKQKKKKKKNRYHLMTESLLSNNTSNRFKFIMTWSQRPGKLVIFFAEMQK